MSRAVYALLGAITVVAVIHVAHTRRVRGIAYYGGQILGDIAERWERHEGPMDLLTEPVSWKHLGAVRSLRRS